ncbi:pyrroline-5-carboxylate reductase [Anaerovorax odorimutans]|uniref:pyrroline-5-carboxylate reductase n=1 Tax=Anaerovorax odorimutans TaxID=109327 RepID=UPI0003FC90A9|nr:pyrroline-5-carboxylate reductase [Anaerovorax odorimutans]
MKLGFIGTGNMGGAIIKGYIKANPLNAKEVYAFDKNEEKLSNMVTELGLNPCKSINELVKCSDVIVIAVKPNVYEVVLPELKSALSNNKIVVSMAAGMSINFIESFLGSDAKIIRIMPNTPAMVNESMTAVCKNQNVTDKEFSPVFEIFKTIGKAEVISEDMIHTIIGISGSSPAYAYMFIEALIDGAVKNGMTKEQATVFAAQSVLGASKMVLETDIDPVQLRINVCSPGGTTIEAVNVLKESDFHENIVNAMEAAIEKSKIMTR